MPFPEGTQVLLLKAHKEKISSQHVTRVGSGCPEHALKLTMHGCHSITKLPTDTPART